MDIGTKIYELRTARHLSQGELADMLDVSRQSVSKWETGAAVPDLDKLIRLCDVFSVTLDELAGRTERAESKTLSVATEPEKEHPTKPQVIIGYILLAVSLLGGILIWVLAEQEEDLYLPIPLIVVALTCSLLCLFVKKHAGYWCAWVIAAPIILLSPHTVGFPFATGSGLLLVAFAVVMALVAKKLFGKAIVIPTKKKYLYILLGWLGIIGLRIFNFALIMHVTVGSVVAWFPYIGRALISYIGTALLLTYTVRCLNAKNSR